MEKDKRNEMIRLDTRLFDRLCKFVHQRFFASHHRDSEFIIHYSLADRIGDKTPQLHLQLMK